MTWRQIYGYPTKLRVKWEHALLFMMEFELAIGVFMAPHHKLQLKQDIQNQEALIFRLENML